MIIKRGFLSYFDECFIEFFSCWKVCYVVLHDDSTFEFYANGKDSKLTNRIRLNKVYKYIAVGKICNMVPNRPDLPRDIPIDLMIGIPRWNTKNPSEMEYFHFSESEEMIMWMNAIEIVLPRQVDPSKSHNDVPNYEFATQNNVDNQRINRNQSGCTRNNNANNNSTTYTYDPGVGVAAGVGLGIGLGAAMTVPIWAMGSVWCQPTIIHTGAPMLGMETVTMTNDISVPPTAGADFTTTTITTTDFNTSFGDNFGNDFGSGFTF